MAKKQKNYKVKDGKIYADILKLTEQEKAEVKTYRELGFELVEWKRTSTKSKKEMIADLDVKGYEEWKEDFETAYDIKAKDIENNKKFIDELKEKYGIRTETKKTGQPVTGFHLACQIYSKWKKKENKKKETKTEE